MSKFLRYFEPKDGTGIDKLSRKDDASFYKVDGITIPLDKATFKEFSEENQIHFFTPGHTEPFLIVNCDDEKLCDHYKKKLDNYLNGSAEGVFILNDCTPGEGTTDNVEGKKK